MNIEELAGQVAMAKLKRMKIEGAHKAALAAEIVLDDRLARALADAVKEAK